METVVISHANCPDGLAAAWSVRKVYPDAHFHFTSERDITKDTVYVSCLSKEISVSIEFPLEQFLKNKKVIIVDYSYSPETILRLLETVSSVTILDHHITANDLNSLKLTKRLDIIIDIKQCGAEIAWDYFNRVPRPWFMKHIRDRDLWLWEHQNSKEFSKMLFKMGLTFDTLDKLESYSQEYINDLYLEGQRELQYESELILSLTKNYELMKYSDNGTVYNVAVLNQPHLQSECGNYLCNTAFCESRPVDFVALISYSAKSKMFRVSLRGHNGSPDLSLIAKSQGGGGHPKAAGFTCSELPFL